MKIQRHYLSNYITKRTILNPPNDLLIESTNEVALDEEDDNDEFFRQLRTVNHRTSALDELDDTWLLIVSVLMTIH